MDGSPARLRPPEPENIRDVTGPVSLQGRPHPEVRMCHQGPSMLSPWQGSAGRQSKGPRDPASAVTQHHVPCALLAKEAVRTDPGQGGRGLDTPSQKERISSTL